LPGCLYYKAYSGQQQGGIAEMKNEEKTLAEQADALAADMAVVSRSIEIIENGLHYATERHDKDMTKPAAAALCLVLGMLDSCSDRALNIAFELGKDRGEA
jgi:hypothetical protein